MHTCLWVSMTTDRHTVNNRKPRSFLQSDKLNYLKLRTTPHGDYTVWLIKCADKTVLQAWFAVLFDFISSLLHICSVSPATSLKCLHLLFCFVFWAAIFVLACSPLSLNRLRMTEQPCLSTESCSGLPGCGYQYLNTLFTLNSDSGTICSSLCCAVHSRLQCFQPCFPQKELFHDWCPPSIVVVKQRYERNT